jgi:hypothetical protein
MEANFFCVLLLYTCLNQYGQNMVSTKMMLFRDSPCDFSLNNNLRFLWLWHVIFVWKNSWGVWNMYIIVWRWILLIFWMSTLDRRFVLYTIYNLVLPINMNKKQIKLKNQFSRISHFWTLHLWGAPQMLMDLNIILTYT